MQEIRSVLNFIDGVSVNIDDKKGPNLKQWTAIKAKLDELRDMLDAAPARSFMAQVAPAAAAAASARVWTKRDWANEFRDAAEAGGVDRMELEDDEVFGLFDKDTDPVAAGRDYALSVKAGQQGNAKG